MAARSMSICSRHDPEEVRFYCNDCKSLICDDCVIGDHKNHKTMKLKEFGASRRSSLLKFPSVSESSTIPKINEVVKQATERRTKYSEVVANEIDSVKAKRTLLNTILDELETELIEGFTKEEKDASKLYERFINNQESKMEKIKDIVNEIKSKGTEILDTEIAKYDVALEKLLKHDPYTDTIPAKEIPRHDFDEEFVRKSGKEELRRLIGFVECATYDDPPLLQIAPAIPKTRIPETKKKETPLPELNPYLEPEPAVHMKPPEYSELDNKNFFHTVKSFEIENSIGHIVPKEDGRFKAWIVERHITDVDCNDTFDQNLVKVLDQNTISACTNFNDELLLAIKGKSSIKVLKSNKKSPCLENSFNISSGKHIFVCICRSRTSANENIACFQEKSKPENYILRRYINGKTKNSDLDLSAGKIDVENPVQISQNSAGDVCITCRPDQKPSWVTVVDKNGNQKFRFPTKVSENLSKEHFDFVGSVCLGNKFISISDRQNGEQLLVNLTGSRIQTNKLDGKPVCCSVDHLENVWIGFDNGKVKVVSYKKESDYEVKETNLYTQL